MTYDRIGFENSTLIVIALQLMAVIALVILYRFSKKDSNQQDSSSLPSELEAERQIIKIDQNRNYQTMSVWFHLSLKGILVLVLIDVDQQ